MMAFGKPYQIANFKVATFSYCRFIEGKPPLLGAPLAQGHAHFSSACDFLMDLGKPKMHTKFEVATISRCKNIQGELQNLSLIHI